MILVDTSVWIEFLRTGDDLLAHLLEQNLVWTHPFIIGELACGNLRNRREILASLGALPRVAMASEEEVLYFIDRHQLMGTGLGYVDAHLLSGLALENSVKLWSADLRLQSAATSLSLAWENRR